MVNPIPVFIRFKDSPRNMFHTSELLDDAQFVFAVLIHNKLSFQYIFSVTCQLHGHYAQ